MKNKIYTLADTFKCYQYDSDIIRTSLGFNEESYQYFWQLEKYENGEFWLEHTSCLSNYRSEVEDEMHEYLSEFYKDYIPLYHQKIELNLFSKDENFSIEKDINSYLSNNYPDILIV